MEILPVIGQTRPKGEPAGPESAGRPGLFATFLAEAEPSAGSAAERLPPIPLPPEIVPAAPEIAQADQDPSLPPPAPALPGILDQAGATEPDKAAGLSAGLSPEPLDPAVQAPKLDSENPGQLADALAGLRSDVPEGKTGAAAPKAAGLATKGTAETAGPPSSRPEILVPGADQADSMLEPPRQAAGGPGSPLEGQIGSEPQDGNRQDGNRILAADPSHHADREARTRGPGPASADQQRAAAPTSEGANSGAFGNDAQNHPGGAKAGAGAGAPQAPAATPEIAGSPPASGLGSQGLTPASENASFAATLEKTQGRAAASPSDQSEQLAIRIQKAVQSGQDRITLRLHPAELGRIDVQLDFAEDGRLRAAILAERSEALDLLQRDARVLERALQDAGLKTDSGSFSFDLREQATHDKALLNGGARQQDGNSDETAEESDGAEPPGRHVSHDGLLDLVV